MGGVIKLGISDVEHAAIAVKGTRGSPADASDTSPTVECPLT